MDSFNGKMAVITGGSSGIGFALAKCLVQEGVNVHLFARRIELLEKARSEIEQSVRGGMVKVGIYPVDVSQEAQINETMRDLMDKEGVPDILINSAGITYPGNFESQETAIFRNLMDVNYFGTVSTIKAVIPGMLARQSGYIVNISSVAGFLGTYGYSAYGATKFAIRGLSDVLRAEYKPRGITVSVVFPPDTQTPQLEWETAYKPAVTRELSASAKVMSAEAVARAILQGMHRKKYLILPGFEAKLFYFLDHLPGNLVYPVMDLMIRNALKKTSDSK